MRRFRHVFAWVFIVATLLGALHEVIHQHDHDAAGKYEQSCPLYLMAQTPVLPVESYSLPPLCRDSEPFGLLRIDLSASAAISSRSRSPPLA